MSRTAAYMVRRRAVDNGYDAALELGESFQGSVQDTIGPRHVAVTVFGTEKEANGVAHRLETDVRSGRSPFWFTDHWVDLTDLHPQRAAERLVRKGFSPPPQPHPDDTEDDRWRTHEAWREWWDRESADWSEQQLADAWAVFHKLRFYDVVEIEMEG